MAYYSESDDIEESGASSVLPEGGFGGIDDVTYTWFPSKGNAFAYSDDWVNQRMVLLKGFITKVSTNKFSILLPLINNDCIIKCLSIFFRIAPIIGNWDGFEE